MQTNKVIPSHKFTSMKNPYQTFDEKITIGIFEHKEIYYPLLSFCHFTQKSLTF